jgi:hypothetical protein
VRCKREKRVLGFFVLLILENQGNEENVCVCVCVGGGGGGGGGCSIRCVRLVNYGALA